MKQGLFGYMNWKLRDTSGNRKISREPNDRRKPEGLPSWFRRLHDNTVLSSLSVILVRFILELSQSTYIAVLPSSNEAKLVRLNIPKRRKTHAS